MLRAPPTPLQGWIIKGAGALCELSCLLADMEMKKGPNQANSPSWLPCNDCTLCWAGENIGQLSFHALWGAAARRGPTAGSDWRQFELLWAVERRVLFIIITEAQCPSVLEVTSHSCSWRQQAVPHFTDGETEAHRLFQLPYSPFLTFWTFRTHHPDISLWIPSPSYFKCQTQAQCLAQGSCWSMSFSISPQAHPFSTIYLPLPLEKRGQKC